MSKEKKTVKTHKGVREYTYLGCPLTRNRSAWCFRLCSPDDDGHGHCGRIAPHGIKGRTQQGIEKYNKKQLEAHCNLLEKMYLADPTNEQYEPGVLVEDGEAEIVLLMQELFCHSDGSLLSSVCYKFMTDCSALAVNSVVKNSLVLTENFDISLSHAKPTGELIARVRVMCMSDDQYLAEAVVTDAERVEIGRGGGTFIKSNMPLPKITSTAST